jgi:hypothetical protein
MGHCQAAQDLAHGVSATLIVDFFVRMNNTGGPVDVWAVSGTFEDQMIDNGSGFFYFPGRIPATQVTLTEWQSETG